MVEVELLTETEGMNEDDILPGPSAELAEAMKRYAAADGTHETAIPSLRIIRSSHMSEPVHSVYEPSLCTVAQGAKIARLGEESYRYDPSSYLTDASDAAFEVGYESPSPFSREYARMDGQPPIRDIRRLQESL